MKRIILSLVAILVFATMANAIPVNFQAISGNADSRALALDTINVNLVRSSIFNSFTFEVETDNAYSIANIYFDGLGSPLFVGESSGINYSANGSPADLPAGQPYGFDADYRVSADNPKPKNGVNDTDDRLTLTYLDLFNTIPTAYENGEIQIGLHLIGFENGDSVSLLSTLGNPDVDVAATPEPGTMLLFVTGLGAFGWYRRRQSRKNIA
jgi:hypothetical protein